MTITIKETKQLGLLDKDQEEALRLMGTSDAWVIGQDGALCKVPITTGGVLESLAPPPTAEGVNLLAYGVGASENAYVHEMRGPGLNGIPLESSGRLFLRLYDEDDYEFPENLHEGFSRRLNVEVILDASAYDAHEYSAESKGSSSLYIDITGLKMGGYEYWCTECEKFGHTYDECEANLEPACDDY